MNFGLSSDPNRRLVGFTGSLLSLLLMRSYWINQLFLLSTWKKKQLNRRISVWIFFRILTYCCPYHLEWFSLCLTLYRFYFLKDSLLVNDPGLCYSHCLHPGILELFFLSGLADPEISLSQCQTGWVWSTDCTLLICEMKQDDGSASAFPSFLQATQGVSQPPYIVSDDQL